MKNNQLSTTKNTFWFDEWNVLDTAIMRLATNRPCVVFLS